MSTSTQRAFEALADPTRREVVAMLANRPMRAGELARKAGVSPPAMSRHLRVLLGAGIVVDERPRDDARLRVFRLRRNGLIGLDQWLNDLKAQWDAQLASFQRHSRRTSSQ
jgi:DNA-binding transcriptional ArsR family regulator